MVEVLTLVGYAISFIIPVLIIAFGNMNNESKASSIIAFIFMINSLAYFYLTGYIPGWIIIVILILLSGIMTILFKGLFTDG